MKTRLYLIIALGVFLMLSAVLISTVRGWGSSLVNGLLLIAGVVWTLAVVFSWRGISTYLRKRSTRYGLNASLLSFLVLVIVFMLGFLSDRHVWRRDMSTTGSFRLSEKTLNVLQGIHRPIDLFVYYEMSKRNMVRDLLTEYTRRNRQLRVHIEDLNKNPERAERYKVKELGTIVFDAGDRSISLRGFGEEEVTNALIKVSREASKKIYFLTGHGEKSIEDKGLSGYSMASTALRRENYDTLVLSLTDVNNVPRDCDVLVIAGPKSGLLEHEKTAVMFYLQSGGRLFLLQDPLFMTGLEVYASTWGMEIGNDRVIDPSPTGSLMGKGPGTPLVTRYGVHAITKQFRQPTYFPLVRSVRRQKLYHGSAETATLAFSGERSWADRDVRGRQVSFDPTDLAGPVSIAMASRMDVEGKEFELEPGVRQVPGQERRSASTLKTAGQLRNTEARFVIFGDSDFVSNSLFNDMGNGNLFLNCLAWLTEDEELIALRPKPANQRTIALNKAQLKILNIIAIGLIPGLIAALGVGAIVRRRATS